MPDEIAPFDPWAYLGLVPNPDGSFTRLPGPAESPASSDPSNNPFHLTKDVTLNHATNTRARIFVPRAAFDNIDSTRPFTKLPVIVYFHAGGFVIFSAATSLFDDFYAAIATEIPAIIVSVDFRCAPEHRLPAAYDDCMGALQWIKDYSNKDEWLTKYGDISECFLMGTSAGGNISYNLGLRAAAIADDLKPMEIKGLILHHAFFGGTKRTESEVRLANDKIAPLSVCDIMWELSLPVGVDQDHPFCNPTVGIKSGVFDQIKALGWKVLVIGCYGDLMVDRQIELAKKLEENGVLVVSKFEDGGSHAYNLWSPKELSKLVKEFVVSNL